MFSNEHVGTELILKKMFPTFLCAMVSFRPLSTIDVTLACNDQSLKAHKVILSAYSLRIKNFGKCLYQSRT